MTKEVPDVTLVVPVFNEEENLEELVERFGAVFEGLSLSAEYVLVDDGSSDGSWELIERLSAEDASVRGLRLSRNFGQHVAIAAGLEAARGKAVAISDADMQDPPEEFAKIWEKYAEGRDHVYGIRAESAEGPLKRAASRLFASVVNRLSGFEVFPKNQAILRVLSRRMADSVVRCRERERLIFGLISWVGFESAAVEIEHVERKSGKTSYNWWTLTRLAANGITAFSYFPLRLATAFGFLISGASFFLAVIYLILWLAGYTTEAGFTTIVLMMLFLGGIQLIVLGIAGEYIGRIYREVQGRPLFIVGEKTGEEK